MGSEWSGRRRRGRLPRRALSAGLAIVLGSGGVIAFSAVPAVAGTSPAVVITSAPAGRLVANGRTPVLLAWRFSAAGMPMTCELLSAGSVIRRAPCSSAARFRVREPGTYTFRLLSGLHRVATDTVKVAASRAGTGRVHPDLSTTPTPVVTAAESDGFTRSPTFQVSGIDAGATLDCSVTSPSGGPAVTVSACDTTSTLDLSGGDDGTYTLSVTQTDSGVASDPATASYTLDVATPTISADVPLGAGSAPTFTVSNIDPDTTLECAVSDPSTVTVTSCGAATAIDLSGAPDGTYVVTVDAKDGSGDTSATASASYEYESGAPPAPQVTAPASTGKDRSPSFTVTDADNVDLTYACSVGGLPAGDITACGATTALDLSAAPDGDYTLDVTATDGLGQTSAAGSASYRLDTSTPAPAVRLLTPGSSPATVTAPTFAISDAEGPDGPDTFICDWDAPDGSSVSTGPCASGDSFPTGGHGDGTYSLTVTATDTAGNSATSTAVPYLLETGPPPAPVVTAAAPAGNGRTPSFTVTDSENVPLTYGCSVAGLPDADITSCGPTTTLDLSGAADGAYTVAVTATDGLGDVSPPGDATYMLDTSTPAPTVTLQPPLSSPSGSIAPTFLITDGETADGPDTFACVWQPPTGPEIDSPSCASGDAFAAGDGDGTYSLTVTATDSVGNSATAAAVTYELEAAPPPAPVVVAASAFGNGRAPSFSVTDSEGVDLSFNCSAAGLPAGDITACGSASSLDLSGAADGTYTLVVTATDGLGQTSAPGSADYTLDTSTPVPLVTLRPPLVSPSNDLAPNFSITDSESVDGPDTFSCVWQPPTGPALISSSCDDGDSFPATDGDGDYTLTVTATDQAGNTATAAPTTYTLDTTAPAAPQVVLSVPASSPGNVTDPQFTVTDPDSSPGLGLLYDCTVTGATPVPAGAVTCGPTTSVDLGGAGRDGTYTLSVTATDSSGNTSPAATASYTLDTASPSTPQVVLTFPASSPGNVTDPQFAVTDPDSSPGSGLTFDCTVTGATPVPAGEVTCGAATSVDLSGAGRDGDYTLSVTATDSAGNTSPAGGASYTLDTTAPPAPAVTLPPSSTKSATFGITEGDPTATLTCLLISPKSKTVFPSAPPGVCPADGTFDTTGFGDGSYVMTVTATDPAGNATATTVTWIRDTSAPEPPTVTLATPPSSPGNVTDPQFTVTDPDTSPVPGLTYSCVVTGPTAVPSSAISCAAPTTSVDLSGAGRDGTYTLAVTATDVAGNVGSAGTASYSLDTTPPSAPAVTLASPATSPGDVTSPQFAVSDPDTSPGPGLTYSCSVTGPTAVTSSAISCGTPTTVSLSGAGRDGTYTLSVFATDAAGNVSVSAGSATYTLDTTPPPSPTVALAWPIGSPSNATNPQFSVTDLDTSPGRGLTFSCSVSGPTTVPSSAINCAAPTTSVDLSGAGRDGTYTLAVMATDTAGNVSTSAGTATYILDTTAPLAPIVGLASATRSSTQRPLWTWQFGFGDLNTALDTATCQVSGPQGWISATPGCGHHFSTLLDGGDGRYQLTVTLTDEAGNSASATSPVYTLDSTAPAGPTVFLRTPAAGAGLDRNPVWSVTGPSGSILMCQLLQGAHHGSPIGLEAVCPQPTTYSLKGMPDGLFTLRVVAVDAAGNRSFPAWASYALVPNAPQVRAPRHNSATAVWTVVGNPKDTFVCTLSHRGRQAAGPATCDRHPTYDMKGRGHGKYTLSVVQIGAEGVRSAPGTAMWIWQGVANIKPIVPPASQGGHHPTGKSKHRTGPRPTPPLPLKVAHHHVRRLGHPLPVIPIHYPRVHPNQIPQGVASAVRGAVHDVGVAGGGTGFPLLLLGLVLAFLVAQNRIDRRDPKLALASNAADDKVEFLAPPSRRERP